RKSTMPKYDPPYVKKPMVKNVNKILTFGSMPSYSGSASSTGPSSSDEEEKLPTFSSSDASNSGHLHASYSKKLNTTKTHTERVNLRIVASFNLMGKNYPARWGSEVQCDQYSIGQQTQENIGQSYKGKSIDDKNLLFISSTNLVKDSS
ncbi:hypothetical protein L9F63_010278, partial [Diploptera punctata]